MAKWTEIEYSGEIEEGRQRARPLRSDWYREPTHTMTERSAPGNALAGLPHKALIHLRYGVAILDISHPEWRIVFVNPAFERLTGYSAAEALTAGFSRFCAPEEPLGTLTALQQLLARSEDTPIVLKACRKDGETFSCELSLSGVSDAEGRVTHAVALLQNITGRMEIEQEQQVIRERWQLCADGGHEGLWDWNLSTNEVFFSRRWKEMLGFSEEELPNDLDEWSIRIHPDDADGVYEAIRRHLTGETPHFSAEMRLRHRDGTWRWVMSQALAARDASGKPYRMAGSQTDITERKREAEALRRSAEMFRSAIGSMQEGLILSDASGQIIIANDAASRILGVPREELTGLTMSGKLWPCVADSLEDTGQEQPVAPECHPVALALRQGQPARDAVLGVTPPLGRRIWLHLNCSPLRRIGEDKSHAVVITFTDITEQRATAAALRLAAEERERQNRELAITRDHALAAARAKAAFLANMSHEIRTPMNAVLGMAELLLETDLDSEQREYAQTIGSSGRALLTLLNDILDFSKIEAGKMELEHIDFSPLQIVEEVVSLLGQTAWQKGLELASVIAADVPGRITGDPGRVRQILTNLVSNAIKFTPQGSVTVQLTREQRGGRSLLRFVIADTGIGMTPEQQVRLFQIFAQADSSTTRKYGGSGLGLAISRHLCEMMGGTIGVESAPGEGSVFWFTVPLNEQSSLEESSVAPTGAELAGTRVLVIKHSLAGDHAIESALQTWKMECIRADSGASGLAHLREAGTEGAPFAVVIVDLHLPDISGLELCCQIRQQGFSETALILITRPGERGDIASASGAGVDSVLHRPIRHSYLFDCLSEALAARGGARGKENRAEPALHRVVQPAKVAPTPGSNLERRGRILVVEDNVVNQRLATRLLEKRGYEVVVASNGIEAVRAVEQQPFDLVFMDCQMPEMDGYDATRAIRQREKLGLFPAAEAKAESATRLPIVAMTANAMQGDQELCLAAGMDDYISKPISTDLLDLLLERWSPKKGSATGKRESLHPMELLLETSGMENAPNRDEIACEDWEQLVDLMREGQDLSPLVELVEGFLEDGGSRMAELRLAVERRDTAKVWNAAHALKGASANMGAHRVAETCSALEQYGKAGNLALAMPYLSALEKRWQHLEAELQKKVAAQGILPA